MALWFRMRTEFMTYYSSKRTVSVCVANCRRYFISCSVPCSSYLPQNRTQKCSLFASSATLSKVRTSIFAPCQKISTSSCSWKGQTSFSSRERRAESSQRKSRSTLYYVAALGVVTLGLSYAAVPLYRIFCQAYSYGGTTQQGHDAEKVETMEKVEDRLITIRFNADTAASMTWNFRPQQSEIKVYPGETALAFYTAKNPTDRPVIGVSTYNVVPFDAGQYFNKIQCFCFEEQQLNPHEEVHMPVFFYIDPEIVADPKMENVDLLTLSYTFFEAREGLKLPIPNYARS